MPTTAIHEPNTSLFTENQTFEFGEDGTRQVSEAERRALERYMHNRGEPNLIKFEETKKSKARSNS